MFEVPYGQDPYNAIGKYIRDHINIIEDVIAVIEIDGVETNQLFMVDMDEDEYFIWKSDWYEGEEKVVLMDFFPVSEAINSSSQPEVLAHGEGELSAQPDSCEYYALCRHGRDKNKLRARLKFCEYCNEDSDGYVTPIEKNNHAFVRFGMDGWELSLKANGWHGSAKIMYCPMCGRELKNDK